MKFHDGVVVPALGQGSARLGQGRHPEAVEEEVTRTHFARHDLAQLSPCGILKSLSMSLTLKLETPQAQIFPFERKFSKAATTPAQS